MKVLIGFLLGLSIVLFLGATTVGERLEVYGAFEKVGVYMAVFV